METVPFSLSSSPSPSSLKLTLPRDESNWDESNWDHFAQPSTSAKMLAELALRTTRANIARETQPRPSDKESFISRTKTFLSQRRGKQPQAFGSLRRQVRFMTASKTSRAQHGRAPDLWPSACSEEVKSMTIHLQSGDACLFQRLRLAAPHSDARAQSHRLIFCEASPSSKFGYRFVSGPRDRVFIV